MNDQTAPSSFDLLDALTRADKWYLGCGGPLLWAPPFPQHLDRPGFWDHAHYFGFALAPLFAVTLLDEDQREIPLRLTLREWRPDRLAQRYIGPDGIELAEERLVTPDGAAVSWLWLWNMGQRTRRLGVVGWSAQPGLVAHDQTRQLVARRLDHPRVPSLDVTLAMAMQPAAPLLACLPSESVAPLPQWRLTPFAELGPQADGWRSEPTRDPAPLTFVAQRRDVDLIRLGTCELRVALAVGPSAAVACERLERALARRPHPSAETRRAWRQFLGSVPRFHCSDSALEHAYWYRWYMLFLNCVDADAEGAYRHPFVCEGIDYFRAPITYSAQAILREVRWLPDPRLGQGQVRTFLDHQRPDGSLPGHVFATGVRPESFYHANWGAALRALEAVHPDPEFSAEVAPAFKRYAEHLYRERDPEASGLINVWNQFETGQEYSPRYAFAQPDADAADWGRSFRLKGVDASVYAYDLTRWLSQAVANAGHSDSAARWARRAERTGRALLEHCWDPAAAYFVDVLPDSLARSPVHAATGLYPFATDLVGPAHLEALRKHLLDPAAFWTPFPVPTVSQTDPLFSADGLWRGVRRNCPWNGRVWPMVNSHVLEALVAAGDRLDPSLLPDAAELLRRFVRMLSWDGDPARPNSFEHYHPFDGSPSVFRGIDDYVHSWLVDLVIQYVCGLRPRAGGLEIRPLPLGLERFELEDAPLRGSRVSVTWDSDLGLRLFVNGKLTAERADIGALVAPLEPARRA